MIHILVCFGRRMIGRNLCVHVPFFGCASWHHTKLLVLICPRLPWPLHRSVPFPVSPLDTSISSPLSPYGFPLGSFGQLTCTMYVLICRILSFLQTILLPVPLQTVSGYPFCGLLPLTSGSLSLQRKPSVVPSSMSSFIRPE
jgi:hypothetical protein